MFTCWNLDTERKQEFLFTNPTTKAIKEEQSAFKPEVLPKYFLNNKYEYIFLSIL